jgi:regulator of sigma D
MSLKKMNEYMPEYNREGQLRKVSDLGAAAYMLMHGHKLIGRQGNTIVFEVEHKDIDEFEQRLLDYLSSEYHRFDSCLMSLKKINESISNSDD